MKRAAFLGLCLLPFAAHAEIGYTVVAQSDRLEIEMRIPQPGATLNLQIPAWAPGSYVLAPNGARVENLSVSDSEGRPLTLAKANDTTWQVNSAGSKEAVARYAISLAGSGRFPSQPDQEILHYSGPSTYLYVVGRKEEDCRLTVKTPEGWRVATGLDEVDGNVFTAPDYDVLADNPVTLGKYIESTYVVDGKPHIIALRGLARADVDLPRLTQTCKKVTEIQKEFFGGLPYRKYVWHFAANDSADGAGGLEHLNSTQISLASGVGRRAVSVLSHEFFHLWNVKRIRSKPLGPFDYQQLPKTGALWWLEGVTDYYADLLMVRGHVFTIDEFYSDLVNNVRGVRANRARLEVSPYEASYRVGDANNGRGNSNGWRVSYYNTGWVVGLCLDLELRAQTGGRRSLDDVMLALWDLAKKGQPGFEEDEIRRQLVRFGGEPMGAYYDRVVMKPGDLPVDEVLSRLGLAIEERPEPWLDLGLAAGPNKLEKGMRVSRVSGPAEGKLQTGDVIVGAAGKNLELTTNRQLAQAWQEVLSGLKPGTALALRVRRGDGIFDTQITPVQAARRTLKVVHDGRPNPLLRGWLMSGIRMTREHL